MINTHQSGYIYREAERERERRGREAIQREVHNKTCAAAAAAAAEAKPPNLMQIQSALEYNGSFMPAMKNVTRLDIFCWMIR